MADHPESPTSFEPSDAALRQAIELLFYAYRDFTSDPDAILNEYGFGRAHHRVVHFIGRNPGITVSDLLAILKITKQSLSRVLSQLVREGFVRQQQGSRDRRQRLLHLTEKGAELDHRLEAPQRVRFAAAFREAGPEAAAAYRKVLAGLINADERARILAAIDRP
ncbi:MAG: MarR family transcriptional regulator [Alphaproteobacteria bacterium]